MTYGQNASIWDALGCDSLSIIFLWGNCLVTNCAMGKFNLLNDMIIPWLDVYLLLTFLPLILFYIILFNKDVSCSAGKYTSKLFSFVDHIFLKFSIFFFACFHVPICIIDGQISQDIWFDWHFSSFLCTNTLRDF